MRELQQTMCYEAPRVYVKPSFGAKHGQNKQGDRVENFVLR